MRLAHFHLCLVTVLFSWAVLQFPRQCNGNENGEQAQPFGIWGLSDHAGHARWLVNNADYAVVSSHSTVKGGWPFANVVSISDGTVGNSTGRIIFYVATMSVFAQDVSKDSRISVAVSQEQANGGHGCYMDPEWPLCARVTILGHGKLVPDAALSEVAGLMFARHPQMRAWAAMAHKWAFYELHITDVLVLDFFGGFQNVSAADYFAAAPKAPL